MGKPNELFKYSTCLKKCVIYRFRITDKKNNDVDDGWYEIYHNGKKFFKRSSQTTVFGTKCTASPTSAPNVACKKGQKALSIVFLADNWSKRQNSILIEK